MPVFNNALAGAAGSGGAEAFKIERSLRFNKNDAAHLNKTFSSTGNRKTWTWSGWAKLSALSGGRNLWACYNGTYNIDDFIQFYIGNDSTFLVYVGSSVAWKSNEIFRDPSAWYHFVISFDTTRSNADDILQVWVNGKQLSKASGAGFSLNTDYAVNNTIPHRIGTYNGSTELFDGYMAEIHFLDGIAVTNPDGVFGEFDADTGAWNPIEYTGNYNYSTGTVYSTSSSGMSNPGLMFDGDTSTSPSLTADGTVYTMLTGVSISCSTSLRINANANSLQVSVNGGAYTSAASVNSTWLSLSVPSGNTLTSLTFKDSAGGGYGVRALEVDGTVLVDGSVGVNGFHLDFSDASAAYKLGKDAQSTETALPCVDFDGNDHLQVAYHSDFDLANNDFTIECYAKTTDASTNYPSIVGRWKQNGEAHWDFRPASDDASHNFFFIYHTGSANVTVNSGTSITDGKWHHIAVARDGSNLRMFVDGALVHTHNIGTTTISTSTSVPLYLGYDPYGSSYYNGQTSNLRIVVGTALYTAAFTKPTTPLTNVTNTKLLCFQSDTSVTTAAVTPNSLTVSSGDPEARSVSDSDWSVNNISVSNLISAGNAYDGSLSGYMPAGVAQATDPSQLASTSNRTYYFLVNQDNSINITVVATSTTMAVASSVYDGWGSNNPTTTLNDGSVTPSSSGSDTSVSGKNLAVNYFQNLTVGNTYTISTKNGGAGNPHRVHYVTGATVQNQPVVDTDSLLDSPTNYEAESGNNGGNYATLSPLANGSGSVATNGNLDILTTLSSYGDIGTTIAPSSGKFYVEFTIKSDADRAMIGIASNSTFTASTQFHTLSDGWAYYSQTGVLYNTSNASSFGDTYGAGDVIGIALDKDNNKLYFSKNGTFQNSGNPSAGTGGIDISSVSGKPSFIMVNDVSGQAKTSVAFNAGQYPFAYAIPTNFKSLCTQNLDDPLVKDSSTAMDVVTYTGDGNSTRTISNIGFSPDLIWTKARNQAYGQNWYDVVRGANKALRSDNSDSEVDSNEHGYLSAFNSDGYTMSTGTTSAKNGNELNTTYVGWLWDAGSNSNKTYTVKVVSDSGNKYRFDDHGTSAVTLDLEEGSTYTFDQSDSSNSGHPLRFSTTSDGTHGGGSEYTTGVTTTGTPGSAGAKTTIVVAASAPTLHYYCSVHSGMGGQVNTNSTAGSTRLSGSLNSSAYDQSQTWSSTSNLSGSYRSSNDQYGPPNMFNGIIANESTTGGICFSAFSSNSSMTWTSPVTYNNLTSLRLWVDKSGTGDGFLRVNGNNYDTSATDGWVTIPETSLSTIQFGYTGGTGTATGIGGVEVNGILLVDSGETVTPVPSINSTVRANPTAGFSVVKYSLSGSNAETIAHGLNSSLGLLITKATGTTNGWAIWHSGFSNTEGAAFTNGSVGTQTWWDQSNMNSSVFAHKAGTTSSQGGDIIAYCFAPVEGYSAFGSYTSATPFVHLGFRPAFLIIKSTSTGRNWITLDSERDQFNRTDRALLANDAAIEDDNSTYSVDFLSNGFKVRGSNGQITSDSKYIYFAFAENPFKYARAR